MGTGQVLAIQTGRVSLGAPLSDHVLHPSVLSCQKIVRSIELKCYPHTKMAKRRNTRVNT